MPILYSCVRAVLVVLVFLSTSGKACAEPVEYATVVANSLHASNTAQAIDGSLSTAATLSAPFLENAWLRVGFVSVVPWGSKAGLVIQAGSTLDLALLKNISIRTYMDSNSGYEEIIVLDRQTSLNMLSGNKANVEFIAGKPFNQIELRIEGLINVSLDMDLFASYAFLAAPLLVELATFQGKSTATGTSLLWSTASERNSDYFVVERADEVPESFRAIGQVQAAGTPWHRTQYGFVDACPAWLCYYRLRQVNRDGSISISPVVVVKNTALSQRLVIYPSVATENVMVMGALGTRFALCDQLGRQLQTGEVLAGSYSVLNVHALSGGVYFVRDLRTGTSTRFVRAAE